MNEFLALPYSPWSEKARWALDYAQTDYTERLYQPMLGEPALRIRLKKWSGPVGVPALFTPDVSLGDSYDIAHWADQNGSGTLFPEKFAKDIQQYNTLSERGLAAGRALSMARLVKDPDAALEVVPPLLRKSLGSIAARLGKTGLERTRRKWGATDDELQSSRRLVTRILEQLRADLAKVDGSNQPGKPKTLLGNHFTYADIAMAQLLSFVSPEARALRLFDATRRAFFDAELADRFADLVEWRDGVYDAYR